MNVKRIIVDEMPEDGCCECRFSKVYTSRFGNDKVRCVVTNKSVSDFAFGYTKQPRPSWCPLVVEEVCEWEILIRRGYDYRTSCKKVKFNIDKDEYKYCPSCGRRIVYKESEE